MKKLLKQLSALILVAILLTVPTTPARADATGVCFTATNDSILDLSQQGTFINGVPYVPYSVFAYFGIATNYFASDNALILNVGSNQIVFYLDEGTCVDGNGLLLPISASNFGGTIYIPATTSRIFGLTYSYIAGIGSGDIVRIKNGSEYLSDSQFLYGAVTKMDTLYEQYFGAPATPSPTPSPSESPELEGGNVNINFIGLPTAELLDNFNNYSVRACFFLTAEDVAQDPNLVRRLAVEGHSIGIYCDPEAENPLSAAEAISEVAFYYPSLMTTATPTDETHIAFAKDRGFALYSPSVLIPKDTTDASIINLGLSTTGASSEFCLYAGENAENMLPLVLQYINTNNYTVIPILETNV